MTNLPLVYISPGHSPNAKGAHNALYNISEYDITSYIVNYIILRHKFETNINLKTFIPTITDYNGLTYSEFLRKKYDIINKENPNLIIELHLNSCGDPKVTGSELVCAYDDISRAFSKFMIGEFEIYSGYIFDSPIIDKSILKPRRVVTPKDLDRYIFILDEAKFPTVIIELGFISNDKTAANFTEPSFLNQIAQNLVGSIEKYYANPV